MTSWRTTLFGLLTVLGAGLHFVAVPMLDGNDSTQPEWTVFFTALTTALGLLNARDHKVSSEDAGLKKDV